jgi:hypothetical protein
MLQRHAAVAAAITNSRRLICCSMAGLPSGTFVVHQFSRSDCKLGIIADGVPLAKIVSQEQMFRGSHRIRCLAMKIYNDVVSGFPHLASAGVAPQDAAPAGEGIVNKLWN